MKKHISSIHTIMTISSKNRAVMPTGISVSNRAGRLIIKAPAPPASTIEPHSNPGGSGSSGAVHSSRGSASKKRKSPGPNSRPKYEAKEFEPPLLMASTASTMSNMAAEEVWE